MAPYLRNNFQGPPIRITIEMISKVLTKMKKGKAASPSGLNVEMILVGGNDIILVVTNLVNCVVAEGKIPNDWSLQYIINYCKEMLLCNCVIISATER